MKHDSDTNYVQDLLEDEEDGESGDATSDAEESDNTEAFLLIGYLYQPSRDDPEQ